MYSISTWVSPVENTKSLEPDSWTDQLFDSIDAYSMLLGRSTLHGIAWFHAKCSHILEHQATRARFIDSDVCITFLLLFFKWK